MDRFVCIHSHFYQPPRENPWLEAVERQDSAEPYHDWNERITAECYAPNSAARILVSDGRISHIVNNYSSISFNFGPTLLSWLEEKAPDIYDAVLVADRLSIERFGGHGNAIAQAYNHMIMPLSNLRDRYTQARWGLRDFEKRFGREAEGMWLPETAVDLLSLEVLSDLGVKFTILAPHQAARVRKIAGVRWLSVDGGRIDPTRAYVVRLPSGREMSLFFYDGPISRAVAFEGLLSNGERFADRLLSGFSDSRRWPQLMHIATDGETYGHHHRHGEMALAYALHYIESKNLARITNYGEFLEKHPPTHEVEVASDTAWSCAHGVDRWKADCTCNSGMRPDWHQHWREPLRNALDMLRETLAEPFERVGSQVMKDPWAARENYINVVLDRSTRSLSKFYEQHLHHPADRDARTTALKLLEMQRHLMLMYTSCGWFFDEVSGIETVQVIMYAARALQLARELFNGDHEQWFISMLQRVPSNVPEYGDASEIYRRLVRPAEIDLLKVAAHFAITSMFERQNGGVHSIYCYEVRLHDEYRRTSGRAQLAIGKANICSRITQEQMEVSFGVLHFGDHNLNAGVRPFRSEDSYRRLISEASDAFRAADLPTAIRTLDRHFDGVTYSLRSLFKDEQLNVLRKILSTTMDEAENSYRQLYEHHASLMGFLADIGSRMPKVLRVTAEFVLNAQLRHAFEDPDLSTERVALLLDAARRENIALDEANLAFTIKRRLDAVAEEFAVYPNSELLLRSKAAVQIVRSLPFEVDLWKLQNVVYQLLQTTYPATVTSGDPGSIAWSENLAELASLLGLEIEVNTVERAVA